MTQSNKERTNKLNNQIQAMNRINQDEDEKWKREGKEMVHS